MCQQQFEAEVMSEQAQYVYMPDPHQMALIIAQNSLSDVRRAPHSPMNEWYEGRLCAAALIYPCVETMSAKNEAKFLSGVYAARHYRSKS